MLEKSDLTLRMIIVAACLSMSMKPIQAQGEVRPAPTARPVPWLAQVQRPLADTPDAPSLKPLAENGQGFDSRETWERRRAAIAQEWRSIIRPLPYDPNVAPQVVILDEERIEGVIRQHIAYETEPGKRVEAYLIKPETISSPRPAAAVFHSTVNHSIRQPAGLAEDVNKAFGLKLAKRGFVTLSPRNFLWPVNDRIAAQPEADAFLKRHPQSTGMARMLFDAQLAVTLLAADPDVDANRIGCVGHSLGAKEVLYLAAFDDRVAATVSSEGGIGLTFSNWDADWYVGKQIQSSDFGHDQHELLALIAPRPFLLIGGNSADGDRSWPYIAAALPIYRLYGESPPLGLFNHQLGHTVPPIAEQRIEEWMVNYLQP